MTLVDQLSRRGIQYGIFPDGTLRVFVADQRLAVTEESLGRVEAAYHTLMKSTEIPDSTAVRSAARMKVLEREQIAEKLQRYERNSPATRQRWIG